ncbi:hypothetical protein EYF80_004428 [Liparis tanakae]|uniref:Uncharacterized protein n=1 Tax=Liparis tanakae TaxID=230148 RepID=A0A4Z2J5F0_9TELE|nr:hypothetical protein EYF80_004428 [Liparis tanakae]
MEVGTAHPSDHPIPTSSGQGADTSLPIASRRCIVWALCSCYHGDVGQSCRCASTARILALAADGKQPRTINATALSTFSVHPAQFPLKV